LPDWLYGPVEKGRLGLGRPKPFRYSGSSVPCIAADGSA
jgi:hypothetical protein